VKDTLGKDCLEVATEMEHKTCARKLFLFQVSYNTVLHKQNHEIFISFSSNKTIPIILH